MDRGQGKLRGMKEESGKRIYEFESIALWDWLVIIMIIIIAENKLYFIKSG